MTKYPIFSIRYRVFLIVTLCVLLLSINTPPAFAQPWPQGTCAEGLVCAPTDLICKQSECLAAGSAPAPARGCREVPLPRLPGLTVNPCSSPAAYIQYWFYLSLYLAGLAALLTLVVAGVWRVFYAAYPAEVSKSNRWILNSILGLILLFGSWLLLYTLGGQGLTVLQDPLLPNLPPLEYTPLGTAGRPCNQGTCVIGLICAQDDNICKRPECRDPTTDTTTACGAITSPSVCDNSGCCESVWTSTDIPVFIGCTYRGPGP